MFTELTINNFKNFKHLEVKDIKLVNTISGFNQSGKTTLLEAIIFLTNLYTTNAIIQKTFAWRELKRLYPEDLLSLFHKQNTSNSPLELSGVYGQEKRELKIALEIQDIIKGLKCEHIINDTNITSIIKFAETTGLKVESNATQQDYTKQIAASFLSSHTNQNSSQLIDAINKYGKQQELVNFLNDLFAEKITSIFRYQDGVSVTKENIQDSIPINLLGDGFRKALEIFGSWFLDSKVILIDELENGLHHSLHKKVIASIFKYAHKKHIQVFIATHNQEILTTINEVLTENQEYQQDYSHYMLANTPKGNKAYRLNNEELAAGLNTTFDLRDE
jgi:AAA15 family ATPase/GTPase